MAMKHYLGPHRKVKVVVAGHEIGVVEKDHAIFVRDEIAALTHWPEKSWDENPPDVSDTPAEKDEE